MKRAEYFFAYFNKKNINKLLAGLLAGLCNGLFGSGGGAVAVVALERMCGFASKDAHATAISIMLPLTFASAAVYCAGSGEMCIRDRYNTQGKRRSAHHPKGGVKYD